MKSLAFSCFICALNLPCSEKLLRKGTNCSRLLEPQKLAPNLTRCSKVAERNRVRPIREYKTG